MLPFYPVVFEVAKVVVKLDVGLHFLIEVLRLAESVELQEKHLRLLVLQLNAIFNHIL